MAGSGAGGSDSNQSNGKASMFALGNLEDKSTTKALAMLTSESNTTLFPVCFPRTKRATWISNQTRAPKITLSRAGS